MAEKKTSGKKKSTSKSSTSANVNRVIKAAKKVDTGKGFKDNKDALSGVVAASATSAKRAKNKKQRTFFTVLTLLIVIALIAVAVYGYYNGWFDAIFKGNDNGDLVNSATYNVTAIKEENLSIHFLELGNTSTGDSVYIKAGENDILIDAGSKNDSATTIVSYLNNYVTDGKLEYVIATHAHEDHLAGFYSTSSRKGVFESFEVDTIIDFALSAKTYNGATVGDNTLLGRYLNSRDKEIEDGATHFTAAQCFNETDGAKRIYDLGNDITLEILYNYYYFNYDLNSKGNINSGENNYSVCCMINQGDNHYLFTGDLEAEGEEKLVDYYNGSNGNAKLPHCALYKAGHHGSKTSSSEKLMKAITPEYVCVCCCAGTSEYTSVNANQFPTQDFIDRVAPYTDKVYVTTQVDNYVDTGWGSNGTVKPMNGNIVFGCTNGKITMYFSNNDIKLKDTDWFKEKRECPQAWR